MEASREEGTATEPARNLGTPWQPWPFLLLLWGIPGILIALWLWSVSVEGSAFLAAVAALLGAVMVAVTTIGVIAQGVRLGIAWSKQDDRRP